MFNIGSVNINIPVALAPMAGVTDLPYRDICREFGCGLTCTELISAKAIKYNNRNTDILLKTSEREHPSMIQLFGSDPEIMGEIAKRVEELDFDIIDLNMGCPVPKVVNNGEGSALMKDPALAGQIIEKMANAVKKPVTVKIRSGFSSSAINAPEVARVAQESGAAAVTVHARTREQYYSGEADRSVIAAVKRTVSIPVIGNGDIRDGEDALSMMRETECDGVMIGRAARGNPWVFADVCRVFLREGVVDEGNLKGVLRQAGEAGFAQGILRPSGAAGLAKEIHGHMPFDRPAEPDVPNNRYLPCLQEKCDMLLRHLHALVDFKGEYVAVREMRKHFGWYMAGERNASALRREVNAAVSVEELERIISVVRDLDKDI